MASKFWKFRERCKFSTTDNGYSLYTVRFHPGEGGTPYNSLYEEAPPERGTVFRLQVCKSVGISQVSVYERVGKSSFRH